MLCEERSYEDIEKLLAMAKINSSTLEPCVQSLHSGSSLAPESVIFIELDPAAASALRDGQKLVIRGKVNDVACCCSLDKTFDMKEAETSNSLLLCKSNLVDLNATEKTIHKREVECLKKSFYEMRPRRPITKWIKERLAANPYDGNQSNNDELNTFEDLLEVSGCSETELIGILKQFKACTIEGYWRVVDFDHLCLIFRNLLAIVDEAGWSYNNIPTQQLTSALLEMFIKDVVDHVMLVYTRPLQSGNCCLHEDNVCRLYAEIILRAAIKFDLSDFNQSWQLAVPEGFITSFDQIKNIAVLNMDSKPETIRYFPISSLPDEINDRFQALFDVKEKWRLEEISPYLEDLCTSPQEVTKLLLKHTRMSTFKDLRVYSRRL